MARMQKEIERLNEALLGMRLAQQAAADAAKVADTRGAELTAELQVSCWWLRPHKMCSVLPACLPLCAVHVHWLQELWLPCNESTSMQVEP
jgi:hypothetical protein